MKRVSVILFLGVLTGLSAGQAAAQTPYETVNQALTDHVAVPAYERLAEDMAGLAPVTAAFCNAPSADRLAKVKNAFQVAMIAWQGAQPIAMGPVLEDGRSARIQFWPDPSGTAARQVRRAVKAQDPNLLAKGGLQGKSVALQNLTTFERLLYGRGQRLASGQATAGDHYACRFAAAIARYQATLAVDTLADWVKPGGYRDAVLTAGQGNALFLGADEPAAEYLKSLAGTLDLAIRLKLERPLGSAIEKARPKRAESWRSGLSLDNIVANLETARALYGTPGSFGDLLQAKGAAAFDEGLRRAFDEAIETAGSIGVPLSEAISKQAARARVQDLVEQLKLLRLLITGPVAEEIGLVIGFNALDGD